MIVNLPNWTEVANESGVWITDVLTSFMPAVYWEIGLAVGAGLLCFVLLAVTGALDALLGAFDKGSDPMAGIPGGNSGMGYQGNMRSGRFGGFGRVGNVGSISTRVGGWHIRSGYSKMSDKEAVAQSVRRRDMLRQAYDARDRSKFNQDQASRRKALAREA